MIYLDNNATTPIDPIVLDKITPLINDVFGNPNSNHKFGEAVLPYLNEAGECFYTHLNIHENDTFIITSGATESINTVHKSILHDFLLNKTGKNHIITSASEHPASQQSLEYLKKFGFEITYLDDPSANILESVIDPHKTALISIIYAHHETGIIHPISDMVTVAKKYNIPVHTDATQGVGKIPIDLSKLQVDFLSCSAHKIHGPKGVGGLFVKHDTPYTPLLHGGGQMGGFRAGTLNPIGIVGLAEALNQSVSQYDYFQEHTSKMRNRFEEFIQSIKGSEIFGYNKERLPNTSFFSIPETDPDYIVWYLNKAGIAVSTGSACVSQKPRHQMGAPRGVRISLSRMNTQEHIDKLIQQITELL